MAGKPDLSEYLKRTQDRFARPFKLVDRVPNQNPDSAHRQRTHEDKVAKVLFGQSHILEREDLYKPLQDVPDISTPLDSPLNFYDNEPRNYAVRDRYFPDAGLVLSGLGSEDSNSNRRPVYTLPSKPKVKVQHVPFLEDVSPHPLAAKSGSSFIIDPNGGSIFAQHSNPATDPDAMGIRQGLLPDVEDDDMNGFGETDGTSMDASATGDDSNFAPMDESNSELPLEELKFFTGDHSTLAGRFSSEAWKKILNNKDQSEGSQEMQQKLYTKDSPRYQRELDCSLAYGVKAVFPTPRRVHADSPIEDAAVAAGDEVETIKSEAKPSISPCLPPPATGCLIDENCRAAPASHLAVPPASQTRPQGSGYTHSNVFRGTPLKQQQQGVLSVKERGGGAQLSHTELPGSASHPASGLPPAAAGATGAPPKMSGGKVRIESPNRDENPDRDQDHMHLKVQGQDGRSQGFKIKKTSVLNKLIEQYCILEGLEMKRIFFLFDGNRVCGTQTPAELNMQNDDTIKVHCEKDSDDSTEFGLPQINEAEHEGDASITRDEFLKLKTQVHELQHQLYAAKSMLQTAFTLQPAFETSFTSLVGTCPDSPIKGTCLDSPIPRTPSPGGAIADVTNAPTPSVHQSISGKSHEEQLAILRAHNVRLTAEKVELINSLHRLEQQSMALVVDQVRNIKQKMHASFAKSAELERQRAEKISHGLASVCREVEAAVRESMGVEHVETGWQRHLDDTNCHTNRSTRSYWTHSAANGGVASVASVARLWAAPDIARGANDTNVSSHHESDESELLPTRTTKWDVDSGGFGRGRKVNTPPPRAKQGGRHQSTTPQTHTTSPTPGRGYLTSGTLDKCYTDRSLRQENRGGGMSHSEGGTTRRVSASEAPLRLSFQERQKLAFSDYAAAQEELAAKFSSFVDEAASGDASKLQIERLSWQTRAEATTEENKTIRSLEESIQRMAAELGREKKRATIAQALQVKLQQEMKVLRAHEQELLALVAQEQVVPLDLGRVGYYVKTTDAVYDESSHCASETSLSYSINREFGERNKSKAVPLSPLKSVDGYEHLSISPETADLLGPRLGLPLAYTRAQEYEASPRAPQYQYSRLNPESLSMQLTPEARALMASTRVRLAQEAQNQAMQKKQAVDPTSIEQNQSKVTEKEKVMQNGNKNSEQDQGRRKPGERSTGLVEGRDGPASKVDTQQQDKNAKVGDASGGSGKIKRSFSMSGVLKAFKLKNSATNSRPPS